jgi:hypothetical protein
VPNVPSPRRGVKKPTGGGAFGINSSQVSDGNTLRSMVAPFTKSFDKSSTSTKSHSKNAHAFLAVRRASTASPSPLPGASKGISRHAEIINNSNKSASEGYKSKFFANSAPVPNENIANGASTKTSKINLTLNPFLKSLNKGKFTPSKSKLSSRGEAIIHGSTLSTFPKGDDTKGILVFIPNFVASLTVFCCFCGRTFIFISQVDVAMSVESDKNMNELKRSCDSVVDLTGALSCTCVDCLSVCWYNLRGLVFVCTNRVFHAYNSLTSHVVVGLFFNPSGNGCHACIAIGGLIPLHTFYDLRNAHRRGSAAKQSSEMQQQSVGGKLGTGEARSHDHLA